jgi:hypothetical protein
MALLLILFFFPILFGAKLLGASWLLAAFITCLFWPAFLVVWGLIVMPSLEAIDRHKRRKRF